MSVEPGTLTIDGTIIDAVTEITDSGGMNTPSKRTEQGFSWSSYVDSKPVRVEIDAYVELRKIKSIIRLRDRTEPVPASLGTIALEQATVDEVEVTQSYDETNYNRVLITIEEVKTPTSDTVQVIQTGNGTAGGSIGDVNDGSNVGFVPTNPVSSTETTSGVTTGDDESNDVVSDTANRIANGLAAGGVAIGESASVIGNAIGL